MSQDVKKVPYRQKYFVALGANMPSSVGIPADTLRAALREMVDMGCIICSESRFFSTPAFPAGAGPDYVNAAVAVFGPDDPIQMLAMLHAVERVFGRTRETRWGQRTLDLDLLAAGDLVLPDRDRYQQWSDLPADQHTLRAPDELILPHPRLHERAFVLVPLADIDANWRHPVLDQTVAQMLAAVNQEDVDDVAPL